MKLYLAFWLLTATATAVSGHLTEVLSNILIPCPKDSATSSHAFRCASVNSSRACIDAGYVCDGIDHCPDHEDEMLCPGHELDCDKGFRCADGKDCILQFWRCDGQADCLDQSDERNCPEANGTSVATEVFCQAQEFRCGNGLCVPKFFQCDGRPDCEDQSDEAGCDTAATSVATCDQFRCGDKSSSCIPNRWVCDGSADCPNSADEMDCKKDYDHSLDECSLSRGSFRCLDRSGCIGFNLLCNGRPDCADASDEGHHCSSITCSAAMANNCSQGCVRLPDQAELCFCKLGYQLAADGITCVDVDECRMPLGSVCSHDCRNSEGSFSCSCRSGYRLLSDGHTCVADMGEPYLFVASKSEVRQLNLRSMQSSTLVDRDNPDVRDAVGISFDTVDGKLYWTNVGNTKAGIVSWSQSSGSREVVTKRPGSMPEDVEVDYIGRNLYYTDAGLRLLGVCSMNGRHCLSLLSSKHTRMDQPRGLALFPLEGLLFYSDWGRRPHIASAAMDGSNYKVVIDTNIKWPNGIAVDIVQRRIFWTEANHDRIESANFDGSQRSVVVEQAIWHPFSVAVFEDSIYWTDWHHKNIQSCNKYNCSQHKVLNVRLSDDPMGLHISHPLQQPTPPRGSPCSYKQCRYLCLISSGGREAVCGCPDGMTLKSDKVSCEPVKVADTKYVDPLTVLNPLMGDYNSTSSSTSRWYTTTSTRTSRGSTTTTTMRRSKDLLPILTASTAITTKTITTSIPSSSSSTTTAMLWMDTSEGVSVYGDSAVNASSHSGGALGLILGIFFAFMFFVLVALLIHCYVRKYRRAKRSTSQFPNPTFNLAAAMMNHAADGGAECKGVSVEGNKQPAVADSVDDGMTDKGFSTKLDPSSGRFEFVNSGSWSQPRLQAAVATPKVSQDTAESMRRCATNPELNNMKSNNLDPHFKIDPSDGSDNESEQDGPLFYNDKTRLIP